VKGIWANENALRRGGAEWSPKVVPFLVANDMKGAKPRAKYPNWQRAPPSPATARSRNSCDFTGIGQTNGYACRPWGSRKWKWFLPVPELAMRFELPVVQGRTKVATLRVPVVLVYLGFLHAREMDQAFLGHGAWEDCLLRYAEGCVPRGAWISDSITISGTPLIPLIRSAHVNVTAT
jgi:hypothetical protein